VNIPHNKFCVLPCVSLKTNNTQYLEEFWKRTKQLDVIRNENIFDYIPEISAISA